MVRELRAAVVLCLAVGVIVGAARNQAADTAAAGELVPSDTASGASSGLAKAVAAPSVPVGSGEPPPVAEVDNLGTRNLTGRDGDTVALTFDDGPHPDYTPRVLDILRRNKITATFCLVGAAADRYPELVRRIAEAGHVLCDHTVTHDMELSDRDGAAIDDEIGGALEAIEDAVPDADVRFFRAPGGSFGENVNTVAGSYGQTPLGWSVDPLDWRKPGPRKIHDAVVSAVHPGAVVLLHDGGGDRSGTVAALPRIIDTLREAGYEFVVPVS